MAGRKIHKRMPTPGRRESRVSVADAIGPPGLWMTGGFGGGGPSLSGAMVNARTALGIAAVWNAVMIYSNTVASLDLYVARNDPRGGRRPAPEHPVYPLVNMRPNPITTSFGFRRSLMVHALTRGNGYAEIERSVSGKPLALHLLDPINVEAKIGDDGGLKYHFQDNGQVLDGADVLHVHGMGWDGITGFSPLTIHREMLGLAISEREYQAGLMGNSAVPQGHIEFPGKIDSVQSGGFRDNWNGVHQGPRNSGKVGVLGGGAKWVQTSFSPADTQLLTSREFSVAEVARIFNIPQHMLGVLEHATFSNIEEQNIQFYQISLLPWLRTFEDELNAKLFGPIEGQRYFCTHDAASILRGNLEAQTDWAERLFNIGALSRNEVRLRFGLAPVEGGDGYYVQSNNLSPVGDSDEPEPSLDPDAPTQGQAAPDPDATRPKPLPPGAVN